MSSESPLLVIGAGPAGLAIGASLEKVGKHAVILEASDRVANAWHQHYERLHLHTARALSGLPYLPMPRDWPRYPSRLQVIEYLDRYAEHFKLEIRFGQEVRRVARREDAWIVETPEERRRAEHVFFATGYSRVPNIPDWPDRASYRGQVLHSSDYRRGDTFKGQRVLVVGLGNSGGEIAIDLVESGAKVKLSIRGGVNVIPRDMLGRPVQETGILFEKLGLSLAASDAIARWVSWLAFGDLSRIGLSPRKEGVATQIEAGRIPLIDVGTVDLIRRGTIELTPGVARYTASGVRFADGNEAEFEAIVLATGYRTGLEALLEDHSVLDQEGRPRLDLGDEPQPGLHFIGFVNPPTGFLRRIAIDAKRLAAQIV
jgi:cation diffusion facilitator CzcD-associated flavoprotein CzcO